VRAAQQAGTITVLAGTNGAGKSSVAGARIRALGGAYFNPDDVARTLREVDPALDMREANAAAWQEGRRLLERAILQGDDYAFETTFGGNTITRLLETAADLGRRVRVWYVGLEGVEQHVRRVWARVAAGGHDIPQAKIRER
jgi:predicted ABC-type ATPase